MSKSRQIQLHSSNSKEKQSGVYLKGGVENGLQKW